MTKRILLTGANGFVGRHIIKRLKKEGAEVFALVRSKNKLHDLHNCVDKLFEMDIDNISDNIFDELGKPDVMIHLAWGGLPNYQSLHHYEEELPRQYSFLKAMILGGVKSVVISGTCFEYGMQDGCLSEENITNPTNSYGFAKDSLHRQLLFLSKEMPFNLAWCRLFYIWGEGQSEQSLYMQLRAAVERGDVEFNMSLGEQLRDYLYIEDVADILVRISMRNKSTTTLNIASGKPISVKKLVEKWIETNDWKIKLNLGYYPYSSFEPMKFWGSRKQLDMMLESDFKYGEKNDI
ncbi:MAG: NAD(P)-dependent oxidoreductase [Proteobacteria bacterium]|nr:NAD(P)-dependent oxidoreductase [Pseudomonadota bacterium]NOG59112.1 NAD(P)-dependent oxidoreductase [Pseudomonadota bacterium]